MGNNKTSLEDVKKDIQGWADSEILDDNKKIIIIGGKNPTKKGPCLLYTSPSPRDATLSRMPSSA